MKLKLWISFLVIVWGCSTYATAQDSPLVFQAEKLQEIAQQYTGSTINWPLVVNLASHNTEQNTFTITPSQLQELQNFSQVSAEVLKQKDRVSELISSGATIFASDEYQEVQSLITEYNKAVNDGVIEDAFDYGNRLKASVDSMETALFENRVIDVQAQLTEKTGQVDRREGLLGSWIDAMKGDLFEQSDGIRTFAESYAELSFLDGSNIQVEPNTIAVIRKSRIDRLNDAGDTEITLEDGGLLAKLSAAGKNRSTYTLNAGSSSSELRTQNFYAETDDSDLVKLTNYDGEVIVNSNNVSITIRENEGTIVESGKAPMQPVKLLPSPSLTWATIDTVVNNETIIFAFNEIEGAQNYRIQYDQSPNFTEDVVEVQTTETSLVMDDLPMGMTYVRVQAIDALGLRGPFSKTARIIRTVDNTPPPVFVDNLHNDLLFTSDGSLQITGATESEARLVVAGENVQVQPTGRFSYTVSGVQTIKDITITAADPSGNKTTKNIQLVRLTEEKLYNFRLRSALNSTLSAIRSGSTTFSGNLYPGIEVTITNETLTERVRTDFNGNWGVTLDLVPGELKIEFRNANTGILYSSKTYTVE
ncbi:MAG TPA: FecR domain-containing protein [Gracilimonas sp.]|uniref:FecR domain-containing protein n=1 Tax=Gracilimonas sp. TaxID=1974203 RepID=UPI002D93C939|nr:FecR domain-containing protein [Gracilimonas sp.]